MRFRNWAKILIFLLVYIFSGVALVIIIDGLITGSELAPFNLAMEETMAHLRTPFLTNIMIVITNIGSPFTLSIMALFVALIILLYKNVYSTFLYLTSIGLTLISFTVLNNVIHLPGPSGSIITLSHWSFPSGHAAIATAFFFITAYVFFDRYKSLRWKVALITFCVLCAGVISFSRLYLGAHYALDVLAGISLGLLSVSFTVLLFSIFLGEKPHTRRKKSV